MTYTRRQATPAPTEAQLAAARTKAARLHAELHALTTATAALEARTTTARAELSAARQRLTKTLTAIEATRAQEEAIRNAEPLKFLPEPVHGGALGLRRATRELMDYTRRTNQAHAA